MTKKEISKTDKSYQDLFNDIAKIINEGKYRVATEVNSTVILIYWLIGKRINDEILKGDRANYGDQIIFHISEELTINLVKDIIGQACSEWYALRRYIPIK